MDNESLRVVITGKGGAGKTTVTSSLAHLMSETGKKVLVVDEDPQMNLPYTLGMSQEAGAQIVPLNKNFDYIEEKTGARPKGNWGAYFRMNPPVEDVIDRFGIKMKDNLTLLVMGTVQKAAAGCLCPENALLDAVVSYVGVRTNEVILMDTQAGVEHFGRALSEGFEHCLVITDDTYSSMSVAVLTLKLAREIGIKNVHLVFNRTSPNSAKTARLEEMLGGNIEDSFDSVFYIPYDEIIRETEPDISGVIKDPEQSFTKSLKSIAETLGELTGAEAGRQQ
ncbi:AAA family ATPase [Limisalsivibrio acetivorans]|uniref:ATP-binding protein n=1 Tax=Limisalsivibrio acetivorans TaxID=1304888 RepID=UPI0003B55F4A|nr:AAA family ATPase [Limisalsivibrio acetivorans]